MFRIWQSTHRMVIRHDPDLGHRYVPNLEARIPNELGGSYVVTNGLGFRSDWEFSKEKKAGKPRILFFGDSYTAGDLCSNHERFSEKIGEALGAEVFNYGLSGSGTDQQLLAFEKYAKDVEADLIVLCVLSENIERIKVPARITIDRATGKKVMLSKPHFTLEGEALKLHGVPVPTDRPEVPEDGEDADRFGSHRRNPRLKLAYQVVDFYRHDRRAKRARELLGPTMAKLRPVALKASGFQPFADYKSRDSDGWRLMAAIIKRFAAAARGTPVLVVPLPTYHNLKDEVEPIFLPFYQGLEDRRAGLHVADVTTPMMKLPRATRLKIPFQEDVHFSPFGHEVVADLIRKEIEARGFLKRGPITVHPTTPRAGAPRSRYVLGVSCFYHNSAACLVKDGQIVAAGEEERFTRVKNDRRFPHSAINYVLEEGGIQQHDLAAVVYYDNAALTLERLMHTQAAVGARGAENWRRFMPSWSLYKLHIPRLIREYLKYDGLILQEAHHRSHAASAFFPSPFEDAAVLTIDGVGEWATASIGLGRGNQLSLVKEMRFPDSLGLLYSAFTQFTGFKVNSGEYKMMGLAPYGQPRYVDQILKHLVDLKDDGSIELNLEYFSFLDENRMTNEKFAELFGGPARKGDDWITEREMDLARSIQVVTEEAMLKMARHAHRLGGSKNLVMAGGVALNCVANGRILREGPFERLWIQPAAGDAGGAIGAALDAYHTYFEQPRVVSSEGRSLQGASYLGPRFSEDEIRGLLESNGYPFEHHDDAGRDARIAELLAEGKVVGHLGGRMEFGPRALGSRSILGDARNQQMQVNLNLKIKYRESFRPFAPSVLEEDCSSYFELEQSSPHMLLVAPVKADRRLPVPERAPNADLTEVVKLPRSDVPAITHVDYSARIQTVNAVEHGSYYRLIDAFKRRTGCPVVVNTSFNVRGEPIVCTPYDAYRCFMRTEMDVLVLENFILLKPAQPAWPEAKGHVEFDAEERQGFEEAFLERLDKIFRTQFLPAAERLAATEALKISRKFRRGATTWVDAEEPADRRKLFEVPAALAGQSGEDPRAMAAALAGYFSPASAVGALEPVVAEVLRAGQDFAGPTDLEESVGDSVYVMF
jgi:carbamoyltransferase